MKKFNPQVTGYNRRMRSGKANEVHALLEEKNSNDQRRLSIKKHFKGTFFDEAVCCMHDTAASVMQGQHYLAYEL